MNVVVDRAGNRLRGKAYPLLTALLSWVLFAGAAQAQVNRNTISGFVWGPGRTPVPQVTVEILNEVQQVLKRTRTDGTGRYFFNGLSAGRFTVRVLPFGTNYEEQSQDVEIANLIRPGGSTSDNAFSDFYLQVRKSPSGGWSVGSVFVQEVPEDAKKLYERAVREFEENRPDAAIDSLFEAVSIFPEYYAALERLGRAYVVKENFEYARAVYVKMVSVNERSFTGWYGLSYAAYALKQSAVSVQAAQKAVAIEPSSADAYLMLGLAYRQSREFPVAQKAFLQAKKLSGGSNPDVHWNLALLYANDLNRFREAADELELYLKIAPAGADIQNIKKLIARFREKAGSD